MAVALNVLGMGATQAQASAAALDGEAHLIRNAGNNLCLQPRSGDVFAPIVQLDCTGSAEQRWFIQDLGSRRYQFANLATHQCFDAFDGAFNGARLLQNQCAPISNDQFLSSRVLPASVNLRSRVGFKDTNFCIDVPQSTTERNVAMQLFQCNGTGAQQWIVGFG